MMRAFRWFVLVMCVASTTPAQDVHFRWAFGVAVILALLAAVCAWFIRDEDAAATMVARKTSPRSIEVVGPAAG